MNAQEENIIIADSVVNDTISKKFKKKYGVRVGVDLFQIGRSIFDDDFTGFEIVADYRINKNFYISGEIGNTQNTFSNEFLNSTAEGQYIKAGIDLNLYENWLDQDNLIYTGFRVGFSNFTQTINSFTIFNTDQSFPQGQFTEPIEFDGLNAAWAEVQFGIKVEVLNNLYMTLNVQFKLLVTENEPDNFQNLFIPGFNRTQDNNAFGFGFGYNLAYVIPFKKR